MKSFLCALALVATLVLAPVTSQASIFYTFSTILDANGPDTMLLDGASAVLTFEVDSNATYVERFGFPAVPVINPLLTISGSGLAANNGALSLPPLAFYPTYAGFFTEPGGFQAVVLLPGGDELQLVGNTTPSPAGSLVNVGDMVAPEHFAPATPFGSWFDFTDGTVYSLIDTTISVSATDVPEPGTMALLAGLGIPALLAVRRMRRAH